MWNFRVIIVYKRRFKCIHSREKMATVENENTTKPNCTHNRYDDRKLRSQFGFNFGKFVKCIARTCLQLLTHMNIPVNLTAIFLCFCLSIIILLTNNNQMIRFISYSIFNLYNTRCLLYVERLLSQIHQFMVAARMISKLEKGNLNDLKKLVFIFNRLALNIFE